MVPPSVLPGLPVVPANSRKRKSDRVCTIKLHGGRTRRYRLASGRLAEEQARPNELFTSRYWTDLVTEAERALLDFVTIEDSFGLQSSDYDGPDGRTDQVAAVWMRSGSPPESDHSRRMWSGPTATVTHTEPFHVSKAIATLDYVRKAEPGWRAQLSRPSEDSLFGRRRKPAGSDRRSTSPKFR